MLPKEDEIYEADTSKYVDQKIEISPVEQEAELKQTETLITNKNLFYELKFALKSKRNEWSEREKKAKRINDGQDERYLGENFLLFIKFLNFKIFK